MDIEHIIRQEYEKGTPIKDIAQMVNRHRSNVLRRATEMGLTHPNRCGTMDKESSLKGGNPMEPTTQQLLEFRRHCDENGLPFDLWRAFWHKTGQYSSFFVNKEAQEAHQKNIDEFFARLKKASPKVKAKQLPSNNLAIFANFDVHIGKHCELLRTGHDYHPDKAISQVIEGQMALYEMCKPFKVTDILLPLGNDIVHVDNNRNTTTSGTPQDSQGSVESQMMLAAELYIKTINWLAKKHNVWLCHVHSNHDRVSGWSVSEMVRHYYLGNKNPRVHAGVGNFSQTHRKYFVFGNSLIMFHHGEMRKEERLLGLIKSEANAGLAQTNRVYVYQGDTHHKTVSKRGVATEQTEKDHSGLTVIQSGKGAVNQMHVETVRSPSPPDDWHARSGYYNFPSIEVFLHNEYSQFARFTHWY